MTTILSHLAPALNQLDPDASSAVLDRAISAKATIQLTTAFDDEANATLGIIIGGNDDTLRVEVEEAEVAALAGEMNACLTLKHDRYTFTARCLMARHEDGAVIVLVTRPATIALAERRRSRRRTLRRASEVALFMQNPDDSWTCTAALLNLSPDGLACRIPAHQRRRLTIGAHLRVVFGIDDRSQRFELAARISNAIQGGSADTVVLGMQFTFEGADMQIRDRLQAALHQTR